MAAEDLLVENRATTGGKDKPILFKIRIHRFKFSDSPAANSPLAAILVKYGRGIAGNCFIMLLLLSKAGYQNKKNKIILKSDASRAFYLSDRCIMFEEMGFSLTEFKVSEFYISPNLPFFTHIWRNINLPVFM